MNKPATLDEAWRLAQQSTHHAMAAGVLSFGTLFGVVVLHMHGHGWFLLPPAFALLLLSHLELRRSRAIINRLKAMRDVANDAR